ncbi:hypothetical protein SAMN06295967_103278 [Belliella buryatensis]|uniref:AIG2-like family protein n=1 Tax=Belliella buryatensis TaxID=1500549 RepID=A0A239BW54_9BACT|nr:gamma-glutamylcyclotransferase family protein [Belliella buryatensis]SNS12285.1 hypothetical protein SAMN06295967_103278 [Belliella buryatensis]
METFLYFGYASNLDVSTLEGRLQKRPKLLGTAVLPHFGFRFNYQNPDGSARANVIASQNESVYGLLYEISEADRGYFLQSEPGYDFIEMEVLTKDGSKKAFTFISSKITKGIFPNKAYLDTIIKGGQANQIPKGYLASIINRAGSFI